jgi:hypothetical protein
MGDAKKTLGDFRSANWHFPFHGMDSHHSTKWLPPHCQWFPCFSKLDPTHFAALPSHAGKSGAAHFTTWLDSSSKLATPQISDWILHPAQTTRSLVVPLPDGNHLFLLATLIVQVQEFQRIEGHGSHASHVAGSIHAPSHGFAWSTGRQSLLGGRSQPGRPTPAPKQAKAFPSASWGSFNPTPC